MKCLYPVLIAIATAIPCQSLFSQKTEVIFRNNSGVALRLAVTYWTNSSDGWTSRGWFDLPNNPKIDYVLQLEGSNHSAIYYYAHQPGTLKYWGQEDMFFCIVDPDFTIPNANKIECEIRVPGRRVAIKDEGTYITLDK